MFTIDELKEIYCNLYEANLEASEEDYLEYYEAGYSPARLDDCKNIEKAKRALVHLVEEILNDTGSEEITREWLLNAGANDELLALCAL